MGRLLAKKMGMFQIFNENGGLIPVTVLKVLDNVVIKSDAIESDNGQLEYSLTLASGQVKDREIKKKTRSGKVITKRSLSKAYLGQFPEGVSPRKKIFVSHGFLQQVNVGDVLNAGYFQDDLYLDVIGTSKGKGFQGVMKKHGFSGGPAAHGSKFHRTLGGTGTGDGFARIWKGTKLPGRMGNQKVTVQNIKLVKVDQEKNILLVQGAVPGATNSLVMVRKAIKKQG